jgi:multidrug resistance efflux pump
VRTLVVLVVLLAGAAYGGRYVVQDRLAARAFVDIGDAVLTADALPVGSADAGVVRDILVADQDTVAAGQPLVRVVLPQTGTSDEPRVQTVRAPSAGRVSSVEATVGGVAGAGEPLITLYDPSRLTFQVDVPVEELRQLRLGMTAKIAGPGLPGGGITTTLDQVLPRVGTDPLRNDNELTVVLVPDSAAMRTVPTLVPGLRFKATVDTDTAPGGTPAVNSA